MAGVQGARSGTSLRAERAYLHWTALPLAERPLEKASLRIARIFDEAMIAEGLTNAGVADHVGVEEKTVRQWRSGDKRLALAAILVLPSALATRILRAAVRTEARP